MLAFLVALPVLFALMRRGTRLRRSTLKRFGVDSRARVAIWSRAISLIAILCVVFALARPKIQPASTDPSTNDGAGGEIVFLLDVSRSMLADDVKPSRLERAKQAIAVAVNQHPRNRIALVAFAGTQSVECALTTDHAFFQEMLKRTGPRSVSRGGTRIGDAIRFALHTAFDDLDQDRKQLVILTDGGDHQSGPEPAALEASDHGIRIFIAGVGSDQLDSIVPVSVSDRTPVRYGGKVVLTRLESLALRKLAEATESEYRNLGETPLVLASEDASAKAGADQGLWIAISLAAAAFVLLLLETVASKTIRQRTVAICTAAILLFDVPARLNAWEPVEDWAQEGRDAFEALHFYSATEYYKVAVKLSPDRLDLIYNLACARYADGKYDEALIEFSKVEAKAPKNSDLQVRSRKCKADALYWKSATAQPSEAEYMLLTALSEYQDVSKLRPDLTDAAFNAEVVERRLAELRRSSSQPRPSELERPQHTGMSVSRIAKAVGGPGVAGSRQVVEQDW
jgi:Ca-activated chloride channel family protein